jgi:hypothetical protein
MNEDYKVRFEDFDKSNIKQTYTRLHYGTVKVDKLTFKFCVYETFLSQHNYLTFSLNFIDAKPGKSGDVSRFVIEKTKEKLKPKPNEHIR